MVPPPHPRRTASAYPRGVSGALRFDELEAAFGAAREAFGALVVARNRGRGVVAVERGYVEARLALAGRLDERDRAAGTPTERAALAAIRSTLAWMDETEPVDGLESEPGAGREDAAAATLRRRTIEAYGEAASAIRVGGETIDRLTALRRLATEPDPQARRAVFEAMAPVWRAVDGDVGDASPYRELVRSSATQWARGGSPVEAAATALGIAPGALEPMLRAILAAWREVLGPDPIEPWDYRFVVGALERRLGGRVGRDRLRAINDAHLAGLGADPAALGIRYDLEPRAGRPPIPVAFTISADIARPLDDGRWRAATPWVFATYAEGSLGNLEELLH